MHSSRALIAALALLALTVPASGEEREACAHRDPLKNPWFGDRVTDHAELLGETHICNTPGLQGHDSWTCWLYRTVPRAAFFLMNHRSSSRDSTRFGYCGEGGRLCLEAARVPWAEIQ